jgi:general secretion pathway protein G
MKRAGFTMIELIFVIVILGILAAVAIPKLAATRNDAKVSAEVTSIGQAVQNLGADYTAHGSFTGSLIDQTNKSIHCATFDNNTSDGNITLTMDANASAECPAAVKTAVAKQLVNNGILDANASAGKTFHFGGTGVTY